MGEEIGYLIMMITQQQVVKIKAVSNYQSAGNT
jgi:hypothetical protein